MYDKTSGTGDKRFQLMVMDLVDQELFLGVKQQRVEDKRFPFIHVELFEHLNNKNNEINFSNLKINREKENVYSLGLIILYMAMPFNYKAMYYGDRTFKETGTRDQESSSINISMPSRT